MAITGEKFLTVTKAESFSITAHALDRLDEYTGLAPTNGLALALFARSRQVKVREMRLMGYRPGYERRMANGIRSWYFRVVVFGQELIAVISEGCANGSLAWVTTYSPNAQSNLLRMIEYESRVAA